MSNYRQLLQAGERQLIGAGLDNARSEALWLLQNTSGRSASELLISLDDQPASAVAPHYMSRLQRRCRGEPLQHILGTVDFYGYELAVGPGVLIPRPETECLVELALRHYPGTGMICDVCTGSAAIALVLACELKNRPAVAAGDLLAKPLAYASENRRRHRADNLHLFQGDLFTPLRQDIQFTLITANPPYVSPDELAGLPADVRDYDPHSALLAAEGGLRLVRRVIAEAYPRLAKNGWLFCEIGETQAPQVEQALTETGYRNPAIANDLTGRPRIALAMR